MESKPLLKTETSIKTGYPSQEVGTFLPFEIPQGAFICMIGPNGAGKSTLLRSITGVQPLLEGKILLNQAPLHTYTPKKLAQSISMVLTDAVAVGNMKALEVLAMGRYPYTSWWGTLKEKDHQVIDKVVEQLHLSDLIHKPFYALSDGQRQKVMLGRALVQDTPLIILDEPTAHLDMLNRIELVRLLRKVVKEYNKTVLLTTHELELALQSADYLWLVAGGEQNHFGQVEELVGSGLLERYFTSEGVCFDRLNGTFHFVSGAERRKLFFALTEKECTPAVKLKYTWIGRMLSREGFQLVNSAEKAEVQILFNIFGEMEVSTTLLSEGSKRVSSSGELLQLLSTIDKMS
ncbi:ABC transporter ATP-binding protein [Algivirga pacifica]|uniref:ABC transporter domain-containing protein n=1 Tax=Algivirga pacifica TaxID=1162670 RepID=A0ABP9DGC7_9BACT